MADEFDAHAISRRERRRSRLSVVVVVYNIPREAPRTLLSLSADYQRHIDVDDYEVIVVDNGSNPPFDHHIFDSLAGNFRLIRIDPAPPSPARAVNRGLAAANGEVIGVMIDGARIVTPGLLHFSRHGARLFDNAVVAALGWYLGYDFQRWSMRYGYDQAREDALLAGIGWPADGYRLFEIATLDESSIEGWLQPIAEANALFMRRELWDRLGGMDERFEAPGGGLVNLDTFARAMELQDSRLVLLLGEGTFHQIHGGVATNILAEQIPDNWTNWAGEYERIRGRPYSAPSPKWPPTYIGTWPRPALAHFVRSVIAPVRRKAEPPLGRNFNQQLWSATPWVRPADPTIATLVELLQQEFRHGRYEASVSIARLIRSRAPDEQEPQRLLSLVGSALEQEHRPNAEYFLALAEAHRLLGEVELAASNYRAALTLDRDLPQARAGLMALGLSGDG